MDAHLRQQFDVMLAIATDRFAERLEQHNEGADRAIAQLRADPEAPSVRLGEFVEAVFRDALLDTPDGALFVLGALARRPAPTLAPSGSVGDHVQRFARATFAALLRDRVDEELARRAEYGAHLMAQHG